MFNFKSKKIKANSILATFVFGVSLFMLCSFGTDAAYVILARYKLQKITEALAVEYCASKARGYNDAIENATDKANSCKEVKEKYEKIYRVLGSGILLFNVEKMEYKADRVNKDIAVKVETTSKVIPAFLRFVGAKEIIIHANACAQTGRVVINKEIKEDSAFSSFGGIFGAFLGALTGGKYADANSEKTMVNFDAPFIDSTNPSKIANDITGKDAGIGDFSIKFGYKPRASWWGSSSSDTDMESRGGFFVLAGYDVIGADGTSTINWVDIGNKATNKQKSELLRVCVDPEGEEESWATYEGTTEYETTVQCYYCIDAANTVDTNGISFDLAKNIEGTKDTEGRIKRLTHLRVYKAGGSGASKSDGTFNNPCDPSFTQSSGSGSYLTPFAKYFNRDATVTLTILNNVSLIKRSEYEAFATAENGLTDNDVQGSCIP